MFLLIEFLNDYNIQFYKKKQKNILLFPIDKTAIFPLTTSGNFSAQFRSGQLNDSNLGHA